MGKDENNFARGSIPRHIINLAGPMIVAQLINVYIMLLIVFILEEFQMLRH